MRMHGGRAPGDAASAAPPRSTIALFMWGDSIEDFLTPLNLRLSDFGNMTGGWAFGFVDALQRAGWRPVILCVSRVVERPTRFTHRASGTPLWAIPSSRLYGTLRTFFGDRLSSEWQSSKWARMLGSAIRYTNLDGTVLESVLRDEQCAAVLVQEYEYARFDSVSRVTGRCGIPLFATFQGGGASWSALEAAIRRRTVARAAGLIIAAGAERERVVATYRIPEDRIARIPNPVNTEFWRAEDRAKARAALSIPATARVVFTHGRIEIWRKGLDRLLDAWAQVIARVDGDVRLVLVGAGRDDEAFQTLLESKALERVQWQRLYTTDRPLMRRWLSAVDLYVSASRIEGMAVAPLEALSCSLPIVATDAPGMKDIVPGEASGGVLVSQAAGDVAGDLAHAIERFLTDADASAQRGGPGSRNASACRRCRVPSTNSCAAG
jgi:glycosyltransferase involved in cell wall biosynthesis